MADVDEILSIDPVHTHVPFDNLVRAVSEHVHVAILSLAGIGGISPSLDHPIPLTTVPLLKTARAFGSGFQVGPGEYESG